MKRDWRALSYTALFLVLLCCMLLMQQKPQSAISADNAGHTAPYRVNINTADAAELEQLDALGEKTAKDIVFYRKQNGAFHKIEEIQNVKAIGPKKLVLWQKYLCVS